MVGRLSPQSQPLRYMELNYWNTHGEREAQGVFIHKDFTEMLSVFEVLKTVENDFLIFVFRYAAMYYQWKQREVYLDVNIMIIYVYIYSI